jgi:hypothetical protein
MEFDNILYGVFERAGVRDLARARVVDLDHNAYFWGNVSETTYWDPMLAEIFDRDFGLSERREREVTETLREVLQNSKCASGHDPEKRILCKGYIGENSIVYDIVDGGPGF